MSDAQRFLLYRVSAENGLGHVLTSLLNAAALARHLNRSLALDMRAFQYFALQRHPQFFECFTLVAPPEIEIVTDEAKVVQLSRETNRRFVYEQIHLRGLEHATERVIVMRGGVLRDAYPLSAKVLPPQFRIVLGSWLFDVTATALATIQTAGPTIGVYFRHGNGEFLHGRLDPVLFPDHAAQYAAIKQRYAARATRLAADRGWPNARFFIASDSQDFVDSMKAALPNAFSLSRRLPDRAYKEYLRLAKHDPEILFEAAQDMWALSACDTLLTTTCLFTRFAALNSDTLTEADVVDIDAPSYAAHLEQLPTELALPRAAAAYRERETLLTAAVYGRTLERVGEAMAAMVLRRRARWLADMIVDVPLRNAQVDANEGRREAALAELRLYDEYRGPNPYVLRLLAVLLLKEGQVARAEAALRRAVAADEGIAAVWRQMAEIMTRKGDAAEAASATHRAADMSANEIGWTTR